MPAKPPRAELEKDTTDSASSSETVTGTGGMEFFTARAGHSARYHIMQDETEKSRNLEELQAEITGKRVWRVGGVGLWAYSTDPEEEQAKTTLWRNLNKAHGREVWLAAARARTALYNGGELDLRSEVTAC
jgi:hypothetical protein